jgi:hypothetical protein
MMHINRFIDKVSLAEARRTKDVVLPIAEARGLRDEVAKLLVDLNNHSNKLEETIQIEITGGSFKNV